MAVYGLSEELHERIARQLYEADKNTQSINLLSKEYPVITMADAYAIQHAGMNMRIADGEKPIGRKIGITSKAMMEMLECYSPDYGCLYESMLIPEGGSCARSELNVPIVEGELAFVLGQDLDNGPVTEADIMRATEYIVPCFEVCDTRFENWTITVRDTICDNGGASRFMLSNSKRTLNDIDPSVISMTMEKNGEVLGRATGAEVMGSPVNSVIWLANKLFEYGDYLKAGDIVLSGSFMAADRAEAGDSYTISVKGFFPLSITFV